MSFDAQNAVDQTSTRPIRNNSFISGLARDISTTRHFKDSIRRRESVFSITVSVEFGENISQHHDLDIYDLSKWLEIEISLML